MTSDSGTRSVHARGELAAAAVERDGGGVELSDPLGRGATVLGDEHADKTSTATTAVRAAPQDSFIT